MSEFRPLTSLDLYSAHALFCCQRDSIFLQLSVIMDSEERKKLSRIKELERRRAKRAAETEEEKKERREKRNEKDRARRKARKEGCVVIEKGAILSEGASTAEISDSLDIESAAKSASCKRPAVADMSKASQLQLKRQKLSLESEHPD